METPPGIKEDGGRWTVENARPIVMRMAIGAVTPIVLAAVGWTMYNDALDHRWVMFAVRALFALVVLVSARFSLFGSESLAVEGRELEQEDLDAVFRPLQPAISRCITDAVGDYPLESGKIEVAFRVERTGQVRKVRITAPQLLMRRGFVGCVRPIVTGLRFPASGGANVVTYPFSLQ